MADTTHDLAGGMSLDQQIGQLFMAGFAGTTAPTKVLDMIAARHVGGIILFARNLADAAQTLTLTRTLQRAARAAGHPAPLLIATDQEHGIVRRLGRGATLFPGQMAQGAIADAEVTRAIARATGEELRALGITMNLAPVMDVANNPANPVIGVRAFGADPEAVARLGVAAVRGYQEAGVAATLKHFPGHGDTATDSHLALPVIPHNMERLLAIELLPFWHGIEAGAPLVMTAHIALPALTGSATVPATLATAVIQGLLRERMGFAGVVMTDCLEMKAISATVGVAVGAVKALEAGADLVLISHRHGRQMASIAAVRAAVAEGAMARERVRESAARVLRLKERVCTWSEWDAMMERVDAARSVDEANAAHFQLAEAAYARAVTRIRDRARLLPVRRDAISGMLVIAQTGRPVNRAAGERPDSASARAFMSALRRRNLAASLVLLPDVPSRDALSGVSEQARAADAVILLTENVCRRSQPTQELAAALAGTGRPLIGVATGDPYDAAALPEIGTWLATYEDSAPALEATVAVLLGEHEASGRLPITL